MNYELETERIRNYIKNNYNLEFQTTRSYENLPELTYIDKVRKKVYSFHLGLCPDWGYAPNKVLLYYDCQYGLSPYDGSLGGTYIYGGMNTIDEFLIKTCNLEKVKEKQLSLF